MESTKESRLTVKEGDTVWARDERHRNYSEWGKGAFVGLGQPSWSNRVMFLVEYLDENSRPIGVCGWFPEMRVTTPRREEQVVRERL